MSRHLRETQPINAEIPGASRRARAGPRPSHHRCRYPEDRAGGNRRALDLLLRRVSPRLLTIAAAYLRREGDPRALEPAALVNELFLRLVELRDMSWRNRQHFVAFAACTMRRILIDRARFHGAAKRGRGWTRVPLEEADNRAASGAASEPNTEILAVHEALDELARNSHRQARVVYLRVFLGHSLREAAELLELSIATVSRDWTLATLWLGYRLRSSVPAATAGHDCRRAPSGDRRENLQTDVDRRPETEVSAPIVLTGQPGGTFRVRVAIPQAGRTRAA